MTRNLAVGLVAVLIGGVCLIDASAQRRRRRRRHTAPRIVNPAISQPSPSEGQNASSSSSEPRIISSADDQPGDSTQKRGSATNEDAESMRRTIRTLSSQVDKLTEKLSQMEEQQRSLVDLERLSRAEQRAESLRTQLRDLQAKEGELQVRAEDIDYALQPANIERAVAGYGSTHPEEAREQRRRQLENEETRVRAQLDQLAAGRAGLERAIAAADAEVERLKQRLDEADAAAVQNKANPEGAPAPSPQPSSPAPNATPSPTPPPYPE